MELSIARDIAEKSNGCVFVDGKVATGIILETYLPRVDGESNRVCAEESRVVGYGEHR